MEKVMKLRENEKACTRYQQHAKEKSEITTNLSQPIGRGRTDGWSNISLAEHGRAAYFAHRNFFTETTSCRQNMWDTELAHMGKNVSFINCVSKAIPRCTNWRH